MGHGKLARISRIVLEEVTEAMELNFIGVIRVMIKEDEPAVELGDRPHGAKEGRGLAFFIVEELHMSQTAILTRFGLNDGVLTGLKGKFHPTSSATDTDLGGIDKEQFTAGERGSFTGNHPHLKARLHVFSFEIGRAHV